MAYQHKINWSQPGGDVVSFVTEPLKSAVLDYHVQVEVELGDLINVLLRDPEAFKITGFARRVALVRALIGKTPDDEIWAIVNKLNEFRNKFGHGTPSAEILKAYSQAILEQVRKIWPTFSPSSKGLHDQYIEIVSHAMFVIRRFFREIRKGLGLPTN